MKDNNKIIFTTETYLVKIEQHKYQRNKKIKMSTYVKDKIYGYYMQDIDDVQIVLHEKRISAPRSLQICVIYRYHFYINHPGGVILAKKPNKYVIGNLLLYNQIYRILCSMYFNSLKTVQYAIGIFLSIEPQ